MHLLLALLLLFYSVRFSHPSSLDRISDEGLCSKYYTVAAHLSLWSRLSLHYKFTLYSWISILAESQQVSGTLISRLYRPKRSNGTCFIDLEKWKTKSATIVFEITTWKQCINTMVTVNVPRFYLYLILVHRYWFYYRYCVINVGLAMKQISYFNQSLSKKLDCSE